MPWGPSRPVSPAPRAIRRSDVGGCVWCWCSLSGHRTRGNDGVARGVAASAQAVSRHEGTAEHQAHRQRKPLVVALGQLEVGALCGGDDGGIHGGFEVDGLPDEEAEVANASAEGMPSPGAPKLVPGVCVLGAWRNELKVRELPDWQDQFGTWMCRGDAGHIFQS